MCAADTLYMLIFGRGTWLDRSSSIFNYLLLCTLRVICGRLYCFFSGYFLRLLYGYGIELDRFLSHANWPRADKRTSLLQVLKTFPLNIKHIFFCLRFFPFDDVLQCDEFRFGPLWKRTLVHVQVQSRLNCILSICNCNQLA